MREGLEALVDGVPLAHRATEADDRLGHGGVVEHHLHRLGDDAEPLGQPLAQLAGQFRLGYPECHGVSLCLGLVRSYGMKTPADSGM